MGECVRLAWAAGVRRAGRQSAVASAVDVVPLDDRTARVAWTATAGADGVNVRYGRSPDKLYHSWLVYGRDDLLFLTLSAGVDYSVAVDEFNGSGLTTTRRADPALRLSVVTARARRAGAWRVTARTSSRR